MKAWAICDTDGMRHEPIPLIKHIYSTKAEAAQNHFYQCMDEELYPVLEIKITVVKDADSTGK